MAQRGMVPYKFSLAANVPQSVNVEGDFLHVLKATGEVLVRLDEGKQQELDKGVGMRAYYSRVEVLSVTSQTVVLMLGFGHVTDARASVNATVNTTIAPANVNAELPEVSIPAGGSAKVADANANRKELRVSIKSTEPGGVYLGSSTVANNTGGWIEPGMVDYIATEGEVWAYNPGGSAVVVSALDLERP